MKKTSFLIPVLILLSIPFQISCAQTGPCPTSNPKAKEVLVDYLSTEKTIKDLRQQYGMAISQNAENNIISLSGEKYQRECRQLSPHIEKLKKQSHISIYKVSNYYFIVSYTYDKNGSFVYDYMTVLNSKYEGLFVVINFDE